MGEGDTKICMGDVPPAPLPLHTHEWTYLPFSSELSPTSRKQSSVARMTK